jgi:hypothetical protein
MNAVEIADAVADLAAAPFDATEFPYQFLKAFDKKETQLKRLKKGDTNRSDVPGGVLLQANIHIAVCLAGTTRATMERLKTSPKTTAAKAKFILATDGVILEAEDLTTGEAIAPDYPRFAEHVGFFLPLAGISTVREIKDNPIDVRATGRLNKLYVELLRQNADWGTEGRRHDMNHFMARLIFCFFAENTDILHGRKLFTSTVEQWSESDGSNTDQVIEACFRAMNTKIADRDASNVPSWANAFPYVNGGLFAGSTDVPRFTRIARSYLLQAGSLDWEHINPDIFGSMIQAVADEEERGALGMHYTSVPNILKVLNPLFLDELRAQLDAAGDNSRMLLKLRNRMNRIRIFDPACGSGNFLVIAYKQMRSIEAEINRRLDEVLEPTLISEKNFRGIELRDFAVEIARLALVIAKYQCDVLHRGPLVARKEFLPLKDDNWITCGNALRLDWLKVCPPEGTTVKLHSDDLFQTPLDQPEIDFENAGGETYICGNPPYLGFTYQTGEQKKEIRDLLDGRDTSSGFLDYVAGWFVKAAEYQKKTGAIAAFVATNSICQGQSVPILWPVLYNAGCDIRFAYSSFRWSNLASHNAGVTVAVVGIGPEISGPHYLYDHDEGGKLVAREGASITAYLTLGPRVVVKKRNTPISNLAIMEFGNKPSDGGHLLLAPRDLPSLNLKAAQQKKFIRRIYGAVDFIHGGGRLCVWIEDRDLTEAQSIPSLRDRIEAVRRIRLASPDKGAHALAKRAHQLKLMRIANHSTIVVPGHTSERRSYLPVGVADNHTALTNAAFGIYDAPLWNMALIASRLHLIWIATVCGKIKTDFRYSNTLGWNTFPVPILTEQNKADLTQCAEDILLAREVHFPATLADLYDPEAMPDNLRAAHGANDEVVERIYIGRRFRNDTERLEKLFEMYTKMTAKHATAEKSAAKRTRKTTA